MDVKVKEALGAMSRDHDLDWPREGSAPRLGQKGLPATSIPFECFREQRLERADWLVRGMLWETPSPDYSSVCQKPHVSKNSLE